MSVLVLACYSQSHQYIGNLSIFRSLSPSVSRTAQSKGLYAITNFRPSNSKAIYLLPLNQKQKIRRNDAKVSPDIGVDPRGWDRDPQILG